MSEGSKTSREELLSDAKRAVAYFAATGQSATATGVWRWMINPTQAWELDDVVSALREHVRNGTMHTHAGRFVLSGQESILNFEHSAYLDADRKFKLARRVAAAVSWIPGVRAVAVCNTLAWEHTSEDSDIDFLIIARHGSLWFVRLMAVVPLMVMGVRPGMRDVDPIDFTFFISDEALDISNIAIEDGDPYLAFWTRSLIPMVDDGVMGEFWSANRWAHELLPNSTTPMLASYRRGMSALKVSNTLHSTLKAVRLQKLFNLVARRISMMRFPESIRSEMNRSTRVIVNDCMLKFHTKDRRQEIKTLWKSYL